MEATITVARAVSAELMRRMLKPLILIGTVVIIVLLALGAWLITLSAWWWLLEIPLIGIGLLFLLLVLFVKSIIRKIGSPLTKPQRQSVSNFVDKVERSVENVRTPYPMIIFYIIRDIIRPRPDAFIKTFSEDSRTLAPDFAALRRELAKD